MKTKEQHEKEILKVIVDNKICKIQHIFGHYKDLCSAQFYNLELEKSESIKKALNENKTNACSYMLDKWIASDNPTLQIAAYKLICSPEERKELSTNYNELTGAGGKDLIPKKIEFVNFDNE